MHIGIVGNVVSIVLKRRGIEWQKPYGGNAEILKVIELLRQSREIADAIIVAVVERAHMDFVNDRVLVPERIVFKRETFWMFRHGLLFILVYWRHCTLRFQF